MGVGWVQVSAFFPFCSLITLNWMYNFPFRRACRSHIFIFSYYFIQFHTVSYYLIQLSMSLWTEKDELRRYVLNWYVLYTFWKQRLVPSFSTPPSHPILNPSFERCSSQVEDGNSLICHKIQYWEQKQQQQNNRKRHTSFRVAKMLCWEERSLVIQGCVAY